jgi:hypothetical protein
MFLHVNEFRRQKRTLDSRPDMNEEAAYRRFLLVEAILCSHSNEFRLVRAVRRFLEIYVSFKCSLFLFNINIVEMDLSRE